MKVNLLDQNGAHNFRRGMEVTWSSISDRPIVIRKANGRLTWRGFWIKAWSKLTRPFRRRGFIVTEVDVVTGSITMEPAPKRWWQFL